MSKDVQQDNGCNDYYHRVVLPNDETDNTPLVENIPEPPLRENNTFMLTPLPQGKQAVGGGEMGIYY